MGPNAASQSGRGAGGPDGIATPAWELACHCGPEPIGGGGGATGAEKGVEKGVEKGADSGEEIGEEIADGVGDGLAEWIGEAAPLGPRYAS